MFLSFKERRMRRVYTAVFLLFLLVGCETEVAIDAPDYEKKVVVHGYILSGKPVEIWLSFSGLYFEENDRDETPIKDASVKLYENGSFLGQVPYADSVSYFGKALYKTSDFIPNSGNDYSIEVSVPGHDKVLAETTIPQAPVINSTPDLSGQSDNNLFVFRINDAPGKTYYLLNSSRGFGYRNNGSVSFVIINMESSDPVIDNEDELVREGFLIFSDNLFSGKPYDLSFSLYPTSYPGDTVYALVDFSSVSTEVYQYHVSILRQNNQNDIPFLGDFSLPISEPAQIYSNVDNGIGIFGGASVVRDTVKIVY